MKFGLGEVKIEAVFAKDIETIEEYEEFKIDGMIHVVLNEGKWGYTKFNDSNSIYLSIINLNN